MTARRLAGLVVGGALAVMARSVDGQQPLVVHRDTIVLAPVRLAVTAFARSGVLLELLGRSPRMAVFLGDSAGEAWRQRTFDVLAASGDETTPLRPVWSDEVLPGPMRQAAGVWLGYAGREDRPGEAELQLIVYRPSFDAVTILPLSPPEAQRLLARLGSAFVASRQGLVGTSCDVPPAVVAGGRMPSIAREMRNPNGEIVMAFEITADGRADPASIVTLFTTERALEGPVRRMIAQAAYEPARGPAGPCRLPVVQPFMFLRQHPASWEDIRKERITRTP